MTSGISAINSSVPLPPDSSNLTPTNHEPKRAFGADDIERPDCFVQPHTPAAWMTLPTEILFLRWVTLTEHKWVIFRERRRATDYWIEHPRQILDCLVTAQMLLVIIKKRLFLNMGPRAEPESGA